MTDEGWVWEYAFHTEDEASYPKVVRDEVKAVADQIVELANLGIDPADLGEPTPGTARRHMLPSGGWFEAQALPRMRPRLLAVVLVVPPPHLL
ncbi:hypothetical protein SRB5_44000 [Streptomyces sp. RB5]|uniref:Uncharacterized protein n=1 Tax=Streptomyces smaragdinus TaxID=2585196 RepID=A0A7K0CL78_9ACTN|nr:hypothetical protein [Streptomyces smaragdinus]MQY14238.1 hypothetical protein [Streptomyces smaragdinus]